MKAVIYARYSSDNQREESIEGRNPRVYGFRGEERPHGSEALHRPRLFRADRPPPRVSGDD